MQKLAIYDAKVNNHVIYDVIQNAVERSETKCEIQANKSWP